MEEKMKKSTIAMGIICISLLSAQISAISFSGKYVGGVTAIREPGQANKTDQFDYAMNLDMQKQLSTAFSVNAQLQMGPGNGRLGFAGPEATLTDIGLRYAPFRGNYNVLVGSFDNPFGQYSYYLTNNADMGNNALITNPLLYGIFNGTEPSELGTLNSLGVKGYSFYKKYSANIALYNGTGEDATNTDGRLGTTMQITYGLNENTVLGYSRLLSEDKGVANTVGSDLEAWVADMVFSLKPIAIKLYYGALTFGDDVANTQDDVVTYLLEASYAYKDYVITGRYDVWQPEGADSRGDTRNTLLPNPGFTTTISRYDVDVTRISLGINRRINPAISVKSEAFIEEYDQENKTIKGALLYLTSAF